MLPVVPPGYGSSPYSAQSAFAGSPLLISLEMLADEGLLRHEDLGATPELPADRVDYGAAARHREGHLRAAFQAFSAMPPGSEERSSFDRFCQESARWLDDFTLFRAIKRTRDEVEWTRWEPELRDRDPEALARAVSELSDEIAFHKFEQYVFAKQWRALRDYCHERGIGLIGDLPIFVAHDSADVWQHRGIFRLDERGFPEVVAGVPPDYFSETGQRWGNPLYRWRRLKKLGYRFWVDRIGLTLERFDAIRLDHFIGFARYWEIPASEPTAVKGRWMKGPGDSLFIAIREALGALPLIAEDLGAVTPAVKALRDRFDLPGIRLLQFAFGDDLLATDFLPHRFTRRAVAYTGTHDNDTSVGWFNDPSGGNSERPAEKNEAERQAALRYLASEGSEIHWDMIRMIFMSVADLAVVPVQDLLGLGSEARMNRPGVGSGNWEWRLREGALTDAIAGRLKMLSHTYER